MLKKTAFLTLLIGAFAQNDAQGTAGPYADECRGPAPYKASLRHIEAKGLGYKKGYTTLEIFSASRATIGDFLPFLDVRGHCFNDGKLAANIGAGIRYLSQRYERIFGGSISYDYRQTSHKNYHQASLGFETLGKRWDLRANLYFPIGEHLSSAFGFKFDAFEGHSLFLSQKREFAMRGGDLEFGVFLDNLTNIDLYAAASTYYFHGKMGPNAVGGKLRFSSRFLHYFKADAMTSYDATFHWIVQGQLTFTIPFGNRLKIKRKSAKSCLELNPLYQRLAEHVEKDEIVVVNDHRKKRKIAQSLDLRPYRMIFIDNSKSKPGNGTFENPYNDSAPAEQNSQEGDIIYVFKGTGTSSGMAHGFVLKDDQRLLGSGVSQLLPLRDGFVTIPPLTEGLPIMTNLSGNAIELANNNEINGIFIDTPQGWGVHGTSITNAAIFNTIIANPLTGGAIGLFDVAGIIAIQGNTMTQEALNSFDAIDIRTVNLSESPPVRTLRITSQGIKPFGGPMQNNLNRLNTSLTLTISNNVIENYAEGITIFSFASSTINSTIEENSITHCFFVGIDVEAFDSSDHDSLIRKNTVNGTQQNGMVIFSSSTNMLNTTIEKNIVNSTGLEGIALGTSGGGRLTAEVDDNQLISNGGVAGFLAETSNVGPDILRLLLNDNSSNTGFTLINNVGSGSIFQLESLSGNTGVVTIPPIGPIIQTP